MIHLLRIENDQAEPSGEEDAGDIFVQHSGDPFIHGDRQPPPPLEEGNDEQEPAEQME